MTSLSPLPGLPTGVLSPVMLPPQAAAAQLSTVAAALSQALAGGEDPPVAPLVLASREAVIARGWLLLRPVACLPVPPVCRSVWSAGSALSAAGAGNVLAILPARLLVALTWAAVALAVTVSAAVGLVTLVAQGMRCRR